MNKKNVKGVIVDYVEDATHWLAYPDQSSPVKQFIFPNKLYKLYKLIDSEGMEEYFIIGEDYNYSMYYMAHKGDFIFMENKEIIKEETKLLTIKDGYATLELNPNYKNLKVNKEKYKENNNEKVIYLGITGKNTFVPNCIGLTVDQSRELIKSLQGMCDYIVSA